jgi:transcriptional regulator with XRE-family HTH domain
MKLTQGQFAELVDLSEDSVGKIERGVTVPTIDTLFKISKGLKLPITEIISAPRGKTLSKSSKALSEFNAYLKTRSPEDIAFIHSLAIKILDRNK